MALHLQRQMLGMCLRLQQRSLRNHVDVLRKPAMSTCSAFRESPVSRTTTLCPCTQQNRLLHPSTRFLSIAKEDSKQHKLSEEDLQKLSVSTRNDIINSVPKKLKETYLDRTEDIQELIEFLLRDKFQAHDVSHMFIGAPMLLSFTKGEFIQQVRILRHHGFRPEDIPVLLHSYPEALGMKESTVMEALDKLRGVGFRDGRLQIILSKHPILFSTPIANIAERYSELMTMFRKSDILLAIYHMPELLTCTWRSIEDKVVYVHDFMGLHQGHMLKSRLFSHSLFHIKCRHLILARAGLYQTPDKHGVTQIDNPTLDQILDTSDSEFARKIAHLPLEEYQAFQRIMEQEENAEKRMTSVDDDDIDEDSDEESDNNSYKKN